MVVILFFRRKSKSFDVSRFIIHDDWNKNRYVIDSRNEYGGENLVQYSLILLLNRVLPVISFHRNFSLYKYFPTILSKTLFFFVLYCVLFHPPKIFPLFAWFFDRPFFLYESRLSVYSNFVRNIFKLFTISRKCQLLIRVSNESLFSMLCLKETPWRIRFRRL